MTPTATASICACRWCFQSVPTRRRDDDEAPVVVVVGIVVVPAWRSAANVEL